MSEKWTAAKMPSLRGKNAIVTGATGGIGLQAALELARAGAHVVLGARDRERGERAAQTIRKAVPTADLEVAALDLASLASIRAFAEGWNARGVPLDILVNNAGVMALRERELTEDGFEKQFGTNHLGHFALTGLLLVSLAEAPTPRVVTVASLAHRGGKIELDNLNSERSYGAWDAYNNSKLANILFAKELDRRARAAGWALRSIPVHPGISKTNIFQNGVAGKDFKSTFMSIFGGPLMQDDRMGALPTLYAATAPEAQGGEYIGPDGFLAFKGYPTVLTPKPQALDADMGGKLWETSERLTGVRYVGLE